MMYYTHLAFAFLLGILAYPLSPQIFIWWFFALVLFGALLPDIDHKDSVISKWFYPVAWLVSLVFHHRGIFHSLFFVIGMFWLVKYYIGIAFAIPLCIGLLSHAIIDSFTVNGINYLSPLTKFKISGFIETGKSSELVVFLVLLALIALKLFFW